MMIKNGGYMQVLATKDNEIVPNQESAMPHAFVFWQFLPKCVGLAEKGQ